MMRYCGNCGGPLDAAGRCPRCNPAAAPTPETRNPAKQPKQKQGKKKGKLAVKLVLIGLAVLLVAFLTLCALQYFGVVNLPFLGKLLGGVGLTRGPEEDHTPPKEYLAEIPDADEYYNENGSIVSKTPAKDSPNVHTEAEAAQNMKERGFDQYPVFPVWSMEGEPEPTEYDLGEEEPAYSTTLQHPVYRTFYVNQAGEFWTIMEINGTVAAIPVSYNMESGREEQVIFTETQTLTSYYAESNTFYETVPNGRTATAYRIGRIDAAALDQLTMGEIDRR